MRTRLGSLFRSLITKRPSLKMAQRHAAKSGESLPLSPELHRLYQWASSRGVNWPKIRYPVRFEPGYIGAQATTEIGPNEAMITVPKRLLITGKSIDRGDLEEVIKDHPELFSQFRHSWWEDFKLILFLLHEDAKGTDSDWYLYLRTLPRDVDYLRVWTDPELAELQDLVLVQESKKRLTTLRERWMELTSVALKYPDLFQTDSLTFEKFTWAQFIVTSRSFGKSVPSTTICPIAELVNHAHVQSYYIYGTEELHQPKEIAEIDEDDWPETANKPSYTQFAKVAKAIHAPLPREVASHLSVTSWEMDTEVEREEAKYQWRPLTFTESEQDVLRIMSGPHEHYEAGAEVYLNYGSRSNRSLLAYYGFALPDDHFKYDLVELHLSDFLTEEKLKAAALDGTKPVWTFKVRENVLCESLLTAVRTLLWNPDIHTKEGLLQPQSPDLEVLVLEEASKILTKTLNAYQTTYEEDTQRLNSVNSLRTHFAIQYRRQRKQALLGQLRLLQTLQTAVLTRTEIPSTLISYISHLTT